MNINIPDNKYTMLKLKCAQTLKKMEFQTQTLIPHPNNKFR